LYIYDKETRIIDAARALFNEKGFYKTSIREITQRAQVAKGTFYLYFTSKENALLKIAETDVESKAVALKSLIKNFTGSAIEKFQLVYNYIFNNSAVKSIAFKDYLKALYHIDNTLYRIRIITHFKLILTKMLADIIKQGIEEGCFNVSSPSEVSEIIMDMGFNMQEKIARNMLISEQEINLIEKLTKKVSVFEDAIEKILGLKKHTLSLHSIAFMKK